MRFQTQNMNHSMSIHPRCLTAITAWGIHAYHWKKPWNLKCLQLGILLHHTVAIFPFKSISLTEEATLFCNKCWLAVCIALHGLANTVLLAWTIRWKRCVPYPKRQLLDTLLSSCECDREMRTWISFCNHIHQLSVHNM